ncbi:hypothetical protein [Candidatus Nitrosotenuis cloacae]|uniref:hypothetical protein n=1 Tax=Candidatus Nitrosotenuis cloacae TaxID=1603555 RepID=UPI0022807422|nr:hypothetical protein [Candidatus Nitrosotenuis cloacae]
MIPLIGIFLAVTMGGNLVPGGIMTFYVHDDDLNTSHRGIDEVSTAGLLTFTLGGVSISGPSKIVETGVNSGVFVGKIDIPTTINGRDLRQGDTLVIRYNDASDHSGNAESTSRSVTVAKTETSLDTSAKNVRPGQTFQLRIYSPNYNMDSRNADNIPLSSFEFKASNGIKTTLANKAFDATTTSLRETGDNTNMFVATIKIPKAIDGKTLKIGSTAEIKFRDSTGPSMTTETLKMKIKIGSR